MVSIDTLTHICRTSGAVELRNTLGDKFGIELPPSLALDFPTVSAIAAHIAATLAPLAATTYTAENGDCDGASKRALQGVSAREAAEPAAIVGISTRYPGGIGSPAEFWGAISSGTDLPEQVPCLRFL